MPTVPRRSFLASSLGAAWALNGASVQGAEPMLASQTSGSSAVGKTPHTRFAVNVEMWFTELPWMERVRAAAALGFPAIEFWPWKDRDLDALADLCGELGIAVAQFTAWGFRPGMNEAKNHDDFVRAIEAGCAAAHKLKATKMCVVGGDDVQGMSREEMHGQIIKALRRAAPIAEANDVMLILEPMNIRVDHKGHCLYGSPPAVRICREVGSSHVKINWDLYHMHISEGDLCGHLREGWDQVGYLQLADHPGRHEPGTGEIHYNRVLQEAYELGYRDFVGLECSPLGDEATAAARVAAADVW
jgi:hydroxypyruvate isomerase